MQIDSINQTIQNYSDDELFELTWNEILYDGGMATWLPRLSFRWLTICVCIIGIIGNILSAYTLLRPRMRTLSTYTYLTALSISNIITLVSVIIFELDVVIKPNQLNCLIISISKALASTAFAFSIWITVCFTVDRFIMICFPFIGKHHCTRRNAIYIIFFCLLITITYLIPQLFAQKCHLIHKNSSPDNATEFRKNELTVQNIWVPGLSELGKSSIYRLTVTLFFNCFLIRIIPFLIVFHLNVRLIRALGNNKRRHRQLNPFEQKRHDVTYMLVIVISTYLICIIPSIPFAAFFAYEPHRYVEISFRHRSFQYLEELSKFLMILNSALQCFFYIFFGKRFRRELTSFLCYVCIKYFYMPIPRFSSLDHQEQFRSEVDAFELVLQGHWSVDSKRHSITGLEFTFHHAKRSNRSSTSSKSRLLSMSSDIEEPEINVNLLKRFKTRIEQFFLRFK